MARGEADDSDRRMLFILGLLIFGLFAVPSLYDALLSYPEEPLTVGKLFGDILLPGIFACVLFYALRTWPLRFSLDRGRPKAMETRTLDNVLPEFDGAEPDLSSVGSYRTGAFPETICPSCGESMEPGILLLKTNTGLLNSFSPFSFSSLFPPCGELGWQADIGGPSSKMTGRDRKIPAHRCTLCGNVLFRMT